MEFEIDFPTVTKITSQEYRQTRTELVSLGALPAYQRSLERQEERLANAADAPTLACKAGCSWCCYFSVDVRPVEVFNILEFVDKQLSAPEQIRVRTEIKANSALLKDLTDVERVQKNIKCPFLNSGRCTIYSARPQTCRNYHATDARGCEQSFNDPNNLDIDPDFAPLVYQTGGAHVDAFSKAMLDSGYDINAYELSTALSAAMIDPDAARRRFEAKQQPFINTEGINLEGNEVPLEFMELND